MFGSIARRQFVPTNCAQLPSFDCRGDKTVITPFSSVSIRIKSKAESTGRKFSDYCREILLNGEVAAVPKMTENEREAIVILQHTGRFYGQISNLIKVKDERWVHITQNLSLCAKEAFKRFYDPHFHVNDEIYKVLNLTRDDRKM